MAAAHTDETTIGFRIDSEKAVLFDVIAATHTDTTGQAMGTILVPRQYDCDCYRPTVSDRDTEQQQHPARHKVKADLRPWDQQQTGSDHKDVRGEWKHNNVGEKVGSLFVKGTSTTSTARDPE